MSILTLIVQALVTALGLLCMGVVGFLMVVGIRVIFTHLRLNNHPEDH